MLRAQTAPTGVTGQAFEQGDHAEVGVKFRRFGGEARQVVMRPRRQHQQRGREPDHAADRDFENALQRVGERRRGGARKRHQHDEGGDRRHLEARPDRGQQRQRQDRRHHRRRQFRRRAVRDQQRDRRTIERARHGAEQPVHRRLERPADAGLHHDDRRDDRPIAVREAEQLRQRERQQRGRGDAHGKAQFGGAGCEGTEKRLRNEVPETSEN